MYRCRVGNPHSDGDLSSANPRCFFPRRGFRTRLRIVQRGVICHRHRSRRAFLRLILCTSFLPISWQMKGRCWKTSKKKTKKKKRERKRKNESRLLSSSVSYTITSTILILRLIFANSLFDDDRIFFDRIEIKLI